MFAWTKTVMFAAVLSLLATVVAGDLCGQKAPKDPKARIMATFLLPDGKPAKSLQVAFFCWADYSEDPIPVRATTNLFGMASFKGTKAYYHVAVSVEDKKWAMPYTGSARLGKPYESKALDLGTVTLVKGGTLNVELASDINQFSSMRFGLSLVIRPVGSETDKNYTFFSTDKEGNSTSVLAPGRYELVSSAQTHVFPSKPFNIEEDKTTSIYGRWATRQIVSIDVEKKIRTSENFSCWAKHISGELPDMPERIYDLSDDEVVFHIVGNYRTKENKGSATEVITKLIAGTKLVVGKWRIYANYDAQTIYEDVELTGRYHAPIKLVFDDPARHGLKITATTQSGEAFSGAKVYICKKGTNAYEFAAAAKVGDYAVDRDFGSDTIGHPLDTNGHTSTFLPAFESGRYSLVVVDELRLVAGVLKDFEVASSGFSKANVVAEPILIKGVFLEKGEPYANQKVWLSSDLKSDDAALYTDVNGVVEAEVQKPGAYTFYTKAERAWALRRDDRSKTNNNNYFNWVFAVWRSEPVVRRELSVDGWTWLTLNVTTDPDQQPGIVYFSQAPQKKKKSKNKGADDSTIRLAYQQHMPDVITETEAIYDIGPVRAGNYTAQIDTGAYSPDTIFSFSAGAKKQAIKLDITPRKLTITAKMKGWKATGEQSLKDFSVYLLPESNYFPQSKKVISTKLNKSGKAIFESVPDGRYILHVLLEDKFRRVSAAAMQVVEVKGNKKVTVKYSTKSGSIYAQYIAPSLPPSAKPFPEFLMPKYRLLNKRKKAVPFAFQIHNSRSSRSSRVVIGMAHIRAHSLAAGEYTLIVSGWGIETTSYSFKVAAGAETKVRVTPSLAAHTALLGPELLSPDMARCVEYVKVAGAKYDQPESSDGSKYPCVLWPGKHLLLVNQSKVSKTIKIKLRGLKEITLDTDSLDIISKIGPE